MSRLLQVLIAMVGLGITAMLGYASFQNDRMQNKNALLALYSQSISAARLSCDKDMAVVAQNAVVGLEGLDGGQKLAFLKADEGDDDAILVKQLRESIEDITANLESGKCVTPGAAAPAPPTDVATAPPAAAQSKTLAIAPSAPIVAPSRNLELRLDKSPMAEKQAAGGAAGYYAVLASYAANDPSTYDPALGITAHYNKLAPLAKAAGLKLQIVRTKISNHFALALVEDPPSRDGARKLVLTARREGWSSDAFVEVNRGWTVCANPESADGLKACS